MSAWGCIPISFLAFLELSKSSPSIWRFIPFLLQKHFKTTSNNPHRFLERFFIRKICKRMLRCLFVSACFLVFMVNRKKRYGQKLCRKSYRVIYADGHGRSSYFFVYHKLVTFLLLITIFFYRTFANTSDHNSCLKCFLCNWYKVQRGPSPLSNLSKGMLFEIV